MFENLFKKKLKYLVIGAGSTGATFACFLHDAGKKVTLISKYDEIIKTAKEKGGIKLISAVKGEKRYNLDIQTEKTLKGKFDVIVLCIRTPDILSAAYLIEKASHKNTVLFSISNGFGIGYALEKKFPNLKILDANFVGKCRWYNRQDAEYLQQREYCELNFAPRNSETDKKFLNYILEDFTQSGMKTTLMTEKQFTELAFERLITRSAFEACCIYYDINAHQIVDEKWETFDKLCNELLTLAKAMKINVRDEFLQEYYNNFELYKERDDANVYSSILHDMKIGQSSEIDFLFFIVPELAEEYHVELPEYRKIADKFEQYNTLKNFITDK